MSNTALQSPPPPRRQQTVLVVDDNVSGAQVLQILLNLDGYDVIVASTGSDAIHLFSKHSPSVVILDIGLPDTDGYALARNIRELEGDRRTLIIALTGWGATNDIQSALAAGCDLHFTKPINFDQLEREIFERTASVEEPTS